MNLLKYFFGISLLVSMLFMQSCKDECDDPNDVDCKNYDPCYNHQPADADFTINDHLTYTDYYYETDTICQSNGVTFIAKNQSSKYTWLIGSERLSQPQIYREDFPLGWITVSLICEVSQHNCLTSKQLIDTVTKRFFVLACSAPSDTNVIMNNPWWGTWEGYNEDEPNDKFQITWGWINQYQRASLTAPVFLKCLIKQKPFYSHSVPICGQAGGPWGYKVIIYRESGSFNTEDGFGITGICKREGNKITFEYKYNNRPYQQWLKGEKEVVEPIEWVSKKWIGHKISNKVITQ